MKQKRPLARVELAPVPRTVTLLGATGSIGTSTVDLLRQEAGRHRVVAVTANRNAKALAKLAREFSASFAAVADPEAYGELKAELSGSGIEAAAGEAAVVEAAQRPADWVMAAITGATSLKPTLAAAERGATVALANKECLVCAGALFMRRAAASGATVLPVDSEHNAIFQAMAGSPERGVEKITLTASGGPFRTWSREAMKAAGPEAALRHPVWRMGAKITIDSATLFNKGLEVIEAARLFGLPSERIEVLVHPQSIVHGLVHFSDGSVLAQLGAPDMRIPIAHTLAWPERLATHAPRLDLAAAGTLQFMAPDDTQFPALRLARQALQAGQGSPTILNAANEVAVEAFLHRRIGFLDIASVVEDVLGRIGPRPADTLAEVTGLDAEARRCANNQMAARAA
jgi:1-deoxy-D-xylulose-5-phosphate reductoisomerase